MSAIVDHEVEDFSGIGRVVEMKLTALERYPTVLKREKRIIADADRVSPERNGQVFPFEIDYRDKNDLAKPIGWIQHGYLLRDDGFLAHKRISAHSEFGGEKTSWQLERTFTKDRMRAEKDFLKINGIVVSERRYGYDTDGTLLGVFDETKRADGARVRIGWTLVPSERAGDSPSWKKFSEIIEKSGNEERHQTISVAGPLPIQFEYPSGDLPSLTLENPPKGIVFEEADG